MPLVSSSQHASAALTDDFAAPARPGFQQASALTESAMPAANAAPAPSSPAFPEPDRPLPVQAAASDSPNPARHSVQTRPEPTLELEATLYTLEQLRAATRDTPQIALVGRSNVGKSSLINALARRRQLAKISATPGKTRSVNLFRALPDDFLLTDLPGYGYARRGMEERRAWGALIEAYLRESPGVRALVLLLDCRLPPQQSDRDMANFARARNLPLLAVLTKADKCNQRERAQRQKEWMPLLPADSAFPPPLPVSSKTRLGIPVLWDLLRQIASRPARAL